MKMTNLENPSSERDPSSMPKINESERAGDLDKSDSEEYFESREVVVGDLVELLNGIRRPGNHDRRLLETVVRS